MKDYSVKAKFVRKMMILIQNQEWRDVRSSIAPAFSAEKVQKVCIKITGITINSIMLIIAIDFGFDERMCRPTGGQTSKNC